MPLYNWVCDTCKTEIDVLRSFSEYEQEPQAEELPEPVEATADVCTHKWRRVVNPAKTIRAVGWGTSKKGSW